MEFVSVVLVRALSAVTLVSAAAAMTFVAFNPYGPFMTTSSQVRPKMDKFRHDPDAFPGNRVVTPGPERDGIPTAAAEEQYAQRAFPAAYVPFEFTKKAQQGWASILAATGSKAAGANWNLVGPSTANFPDVLTFSGAFYTTSGRVTALAISPDCGKHGCRVWVAAAGGGIWRSDDGIALHPTWTFISGSFATNAIGALTYDAATNTIYAGTGEANASADSEAGFGIYKSTDGGDSWTHLAAETSAVA